MSFQSDLLSVFKKYPFIHIDLSGQLSIIVPLTGAQRIMEHFSTTPDESRSLYLFGDNTCKSDLERRKFFDGKRIPGRWANSQYIPARYDSEPFGDLFNRLINDVQRLKNNRDHSEVIFLETILSSLKSQKEAVDFYMNENPDLMHMKMDLMKQNELCISKGEFVVAMQQDNIRNLELPNFRSVVNPREIASKKIIDVSSISACLNALAKIKLPIQSDKRADLISDALQQVSFAAYDLSLHNNWITLLRTVYASILQKNQSLPKELPDDGHLKELLEYVSVYDQNNDLWDDESARDAAGGVLRQVIGMGFCDKQVTDFTSCYQLAFPDYCQMNEGAVNEGKLAKTQSYQLFVLQTFLYLSAMQMHLKGDECAKNFLEIIRRPSNLKTLVDTLCRNESSFKSWMQKHFQISAEEYQKIATATHEIATAHLEVPHYDEARIACISEQVRDSKYTVMAGRLCWSAIPLTEYSSIDSLAKQANAMEQNFQVFIEKRPDYVAHDAIYNDMLEQLDAGDAYDLIEANIPYLPQVYKELVLTRAVAKNRIPCIEFLIKQQIYVPKVFKDIYAASPFNRDLVEMFFKHDSRYVAQISVDKLIYAAEVNDFETVKFFVTYCPGLINEKDALGLTALMYVDYGNSQLFEYLMDNGIDININTPESSGVFTAANLATTGASTKTKALFHNYHQNLEHKFQNNPDHATKFTMSHLVNAVDNMDYKLVKLLLKYCPHIVNELEPSFLNQIHSIQKKLFLTEFKNLLSTLSEFKFKNTPSYRKKAAAACVLYAELDKAGQQFFGTRINAESYNLFKQRCDKALEKAKPILAEHRGWYRYSYALRGFLGVVSALTIIPALCVQFASKEGYANTFFGKQDRIKTNTFHQLEKAENNLHQEAAQFLFM